MDANLIFRDASAGNLTADMAVVYLNTGKLTNQLVVRITVPQIAEANDTIAPTIHLSVDGAGAGEETIVPPVITKAIVDGGKKVFHYKVPQSRYPYVGLALDITDADAGGDFNAGAVEAVLAPAGMYTDF